MDKERLLARLEQLIQAKERMTADLNALLGAIEECQYWINQLTPGEPGEVEKQA